jgi:hypothetical protein
LINAQEAVFTCDESGEYFYKQNGCFPSLEETLESKYSKRSKFISRYKFILPREKTGHLRELLANENIHRASLMPTYDNVAKQSLLDIGIDLEKRNRERKAAQ